MLSTICSAADVALILKTSWNHYKKQKIDLIGRPLADVDQANLSLGSQGKDLTFSETVSYVLFRAALMNDKKTFDLVWDWSVANLMRRNVPRVFNWETSRWESVPECKKDYLFAWRYTPNIKRTGMGGVIYVPESSLTSFGWRNGLDVAPDGDELIIASLVMAHNQWGSRSGNQNYLNFAKNMSHDLWDKCVAIRSFGLIETFENPSSPDKWFSYGDQNGNMSKSLEEEKGNTFLQVQSFNSTWFGIGRYLGGADLRAMDALVFKTRDNCGSTLILEDNFGQKIEMEKRYASTTSLQEVRVVLNKSGSFNWSNVKNIMFQPMDDRFVLDDVRFVNKSSASQEKQYVLLSNDRGDPWINPSYIMPFLYPILAKLDVEHPWELLGIQSIAMLLESKHITLTNQQGVVFKGNGALFPDWCSFGVDGKLGELPWAQDGVVDDYLFSWDAFRSFYFLSLTQTMLPGTGVSSLLKGKSYDFLKGKLMSDQKLLGGYAIDGRNLAIRGIQYEYPSTYGVYAAYFTAVGDAASRMKMLDKLQGMYDRRGYWGGEAKDYYKQNWAWLGLEFSHNKGRNIAALLTIHDQVAMK